MGTKKKVVVSGSTFAKEILAKIDEAKACSCFNVQTLRWIFEPMGSDDLKKFEDALTLDETIDFTYDCSSVGYLYAGSASLNADIVDV